MISVILLYTGSAIIFLWGIGHIIPTKSVANGFGQISEDNKRIIVMEWIAEGLTLCFIGTLVFLVTIFGGPLNPVSRIVFRSCCVMLLIMATLTLNTGAKTSIKPIKICPYVKTSVALLFLLGSLSF